MSRRAADRPQGRGYAPARPGARPTADRILAELRSRADPSSAAGMARFGIRGGEVLGGTGMPTLRKMAKPLGRDQEAARELWASGVLEARILAALVADPDALKRTEAESWLLDVDNWAVCDALCGDVLDRTPYAYRAAVDWSSRDEEFVKRAAFSLMAQLAVHDKAAEDARFEAFLPVIVREAPDRRNFVRKAVNWALRQIGKRNLTLNAAAVEAAHEIRAGPRSGWWVASDALRELRSDAVQRRLQGKAAGPEPG